MFSAEAQMSEKPFSDGLPEAFRRASGGFFEKSSIPEPIFRAENCGNKKIRLSLHPQQGGLAQLARALAWHARGHEFESRILHSMRAAHRICTLKTAYMEIQNDQEEYLDQDFRGNRGSDYS